MYGPPAVSRYLFTWSEFLNDVLQFDGSVQLFTKSSTFTEVPTFLNTTLNSVLGASLSATINFVSYVLSLHLIVTLYSPILVVSTFLLSTLHTLEFPEILDV